MSLGIQDGAAAERRAEAYWFLAGLIAAPITQDALERLVGAAGEAREPGGGIVDDLIAALVGELDCALLAQRLATEHARLFLGLREGYGLPPPYESLWREGCLLGTSTRAVAAAYVETGFEDPGLCGPCDHLASELRFLASLCHAEAQAQGTDQVAEALWARQRQAELLERHLLAWVPEYCGRLMEDAREPFYRGLARAIGGLLEAEAPSLAASAEAIEGSGPARLDGAQSQGGMA
jgi:putative dimethyl sulfoxide reductase chaperone